MYTLLYSYDNIILLYFVAIHTWVTGQGQYVVMSES